MPSPPDKRVDDEIQQFLTWSAAQAREGYTIANLMLRQEQFMTHTATRMHNQDVKIQGQDTKLYDMNGRVSELETNQSELYEIVGTTAQALAAVKRRVRVGPQDTEMDTGVHHLAAIQQRLSEQEQKRRDSERIKAEDQVWWKRTIVQVVLAVFGFIGVTVINILITLSVVNANASHGAPPPPPPTFPAR